jgi:hypothetical protein
VLFYKSKSRKPPTTQIVSVRPDQMQVRNEFKEPVLFVFNDPAIIGDPTGDETKANVANSVLCHMVGKAFLVLARKNARGSGWAFV